MAQAWPCGGQLCDCSAPGRTPTPTGLAVGRPIGVEDFQPPRLEIASRCLKNRTGET